MVRLVVRNLDPEVVMEPDGPALRCYFLEEMFEAAKDALDKRVRVTGSRPVKEGRKTLPLKLSRLEILDEP